MVLRKDVGAIMNEYIKKFNDFIAEIQKKENEISELLRYYDLQRADLLHLLEFESLDAIAMAKVTKKIKEISMKRRDAKEQYRELQAVSAKIQKKVIKDITPLEKDPKKYNTDIVKEFICKA